jgi:hypothetical protein
MREWIEEVAATSTDDVTFYLEDDRDHDRPYWTI